MIDVGVTGHRLIPQAAEAAVRHRVNQVVTSLPYPFRGISCLAVGADQIFARAVLDAGGQLTAVVPCRRYEATFAPEELEDYRSLLAQAHKVVELDFDEPTEEAFMAGGEEVVRRCQLLVAVWDGRPAAGRGGTGDVVELARAQAREVTVIWEEGAQRDAGE